MVSAPRSPDSNDTELGTVIKISPPAGIEFLGSNKNVNVFNYEATYELWLIVASPMNESSTKVSKIEEV